jgi:hypothetical protein
MKIFAIDPGPNTSAYVRLERNSGKNPTILEAVEVENESLLSLLQLIRSTSTELVIEKVACYGMTVGKDIFDTVFWTGRFFERASCTDKHRLERRDVKMHLCNSARAKDKNIRQALIDRYGGDTIAIGSKKEPGPLYGIKSDMWAALAVGITYFDGIRTKE